MGRPTRSALPTGVSGGSWLGQVTAGQTCWPSGTEGDIEDRGDTANSMSDLLGPAFDVAGVGFGLFLIGYMLWQVFAYRRRAGTLSPRAARVWKWRVVLGLCGGSMAICFGGGDLLERVGVGGFGWLLIPGIFATVGLLAALLRLANLEGIERSRRRQPDGDTR